jgi:hypothetical protein
MVTFDERIAQLNPQRRAKIEAQINERCREYVVLRELRERLNLTQVK